MSAELRKRVSLPESEAGVDAIEPVSFRGSAEPFDSRAEKQKRKYRDSATDQIRPVCGIE